MFLINSRRSHFTAAFSFRLAPKLLRHPFFRSYGAILPSSLTRIIPSALAYSASLPVSVCGTATEKTRYEVFLGGLTWSVPRTRRFGSHLSSRVAPCGAALRIFLKGSPSDLDRNPVNGWSILPLLPFADNAFSAGPEY